ELAAVEEQAGRLGEATDTLASVLAGLDAAGADEALRAVFAATVGIGRVVGILPPVEVGLEERLARLERGTWEATVAAGVLATVHH
ncbi:hypothetical protein, partial [Streptomyces niveiscabiei]|uniref:hypothetical protein n=1 Tax=Streptomyces niveiscabiei TaxID=164115 RepID=UPI0038F797DF